MGMRLGLLGGQAVNRGLLLKLMRILGIGGGALEAYMSLNIVRS